MKSPFFIFLFATLLSIASILAADLPLSIPASQLGAAKQAKELCEQGRYLAAEAVYEGILTAAPDNLYVLSNLGVARIRARKLEAAADALRRAIAVAPADDFSHCMLGIVYYAQGSYDEAVNALTKALAINPKNATAHQYLSVVASQKGWHEVAQKELDTATKLDPSLKPEPRLPGFRAPLEKSRLQLPSPSK